MSGKGSCMVYARIVRGPVGVALQREGMGRMAYGERLFR
jgi:hypothetical protein